MSLSTNQSIIRGSFTSNGSVARLSLPWEPSKIELLNITKFGSAAASTPVITAMWQSGMPSNSVLTGNKTNAAATIAIPAMNTTQGVVIRNTSDQTPGAAVSGGTITRGATTTVDQTAHGLLVGDTVRITNSTGMLQIAGWEFTVTSVPTANQFIIGTLDSSGFAADATAVTTRYVPFSVYYPRYMYITAITQATQAVVQLSMSSPLDDADIMEVGQLVTLVIPSEFGMVEADGAQAEIVAVDNVNGSYTLDLDTSAYTAFAFPTSAVAANGVNFPQMVPFGNVLPNVGVNSEFNQSVYEVQLGTNAIGAANDVMQWVAYQSLAI